MKGAPAKITKKSIEAFVTLVNSGVRKKQAAAELGLVFGSIKYACNRLGIEYPAHVNARERIKKYEDKILAKEISQHQVASELGISQCQVNKLYRELGYPSLPIGSNPNRSPITAAEQHAICQQVLDFVKANGGYISHAIKKLGFNIDRTVVHGYARRKKFDYRRWRFAHRCFGYWKTLPGVPVRKGKADYLLPAVCTKCGTIHTVSLINMRTGNSTMCQSCSRKGRKFRSVKCVTTGKIFTSIQALANHLGIPKSTLSIRQKLLCEGSYDHDDLTYIFIPRVSVRDKSLTVVKPR